jgi:urea transporter
MSTSATQTGLPTVQVIAASAALCGCERVPSINLLGAFFPSWMLCVVVGIVLTLVGRRALTAAGLEPWIGPRGLVYPALALSFTLATWVIFFHG